MAAPASTRVAIVTFILAIAAIGAYAQSPPNSWTISATGYCYSIGQQCSATLTLYLVAGNNYTFTTGQGVGSHPPVFVTDTSRNFTYNRVSYASPNPASGINTIGTVITLAIPSDATGKIYFDCAIHNFRGTINIINPAQTITSTSSCNGYAVNGGACKDSSTTGIDGITLVAGYTYTFSLSVSSSHPTVFTKSTSTPIAAASLWSAASPNPAGGTITGDVTVTVPLYTSDTTIYFYCVVHSFYGTITIVGAQTQLASSSASSIVSVSSSTGGGSTSNTHTISSSCFGYSLDGGACSTTTPDLGLSLTLMKGQTYTFTLTGLTEHPMIFTTSKTSPTTSLYSHVTPAQSASGLASGTLTMTIPSDDTTSTIYFWCVPHGFYGTITLTGSSSTSTGTTGSSTSTGTADVGAATSSASVSTAIVSAVAIAAAAALL